MKNIPLIVFAFSLSLHVFSQSEGIKLKIDGAEKLQQLDGFGVNINTTWWFNGEYRDASLTEPAIDLLIDSLGATIFRAVIEDIDWEAVNDNNDPNEFNWTYYNKVFSSRRFKDVWETLGYLNRKGITDGLILSFMGSPPAAPPLAPKDKMLSWMGDTDYSIDPAMEDEFVESLAAMLYYARNTAKIQFFLVSPMNETDVLSVTKSDDHPDGIVEGPNIPDAVQYTRIVKKLGRKLDAIGLNDIRFVMPDASDEPLATSCMEQMAQDSYIMSKLAHWGVHQYGDSNVNYWQEVNKPSFSNKSIWVTEMAGIRHLLAQLDDGAKAYMFWDGFDCVYQHARRNGYGSEPPNDWVFWEGPEIGKPLIAYNAASNSWTPRKTFYQFAQLFKYVEPGATLIGSAVNDSSLVVCSFLNPNGELVIVGRSTADQSISLDGILLSLPLIHRLKMIYTTPDLSLQPGDDIILNGNRLSVSIPPDCIFTLTGISKSN